MTFWNKTIKYAWVCVCKQNIKNDFIQNSTITVPNKPHLKPRMVQERLGRVRVKKRGEEMEREREGGGV